MRHLYRGPTVALQVERDDSARLRVLVYNELGQYFSSIQLHVNYMCTSTAHAGKDTAPISMWRVGGASLRSTE